eukprot:CAMPEP_0115447666 /NCGR_PEP_ID=MMETSP0271-20121206/40086_1 /TAXON_ID=71861 /ORGANISM="Scrippsiella trochoidea, Strain CCMP3099" /LENGTH=258 /DNA_ID=CAMNT_0002873749 /DNA_START=74 /DNA_END=850 /DNA_ORIENTATION=-
MAAVRDPDSFYVQDCRQVQNYTHAIQTLTGQISRQVGTLESGRDFQNCRRMVDDAVRQATETRSILARIREHQQQAQNPSERNNRRMMYQKLSDNLAITARVLEDVVRRVQTEEARRLPTENRRQLGGASDADAAGGEELLDTSAGLGMDLKQPRDHVESFEEEMESEKCKALRRVDEDMRCLQRIYTDLAVAADEQQSSFDSLETHMASAADDVERGRYEIQVAGKYGWGQQFKRKLYTLGGSALALIAVTAYLTSG